MKLRCPNFWEHKLKLMMRGNLIIGAGGHGKVIADIMLSCGMAVMGFLDDNPFLIGKQILGLPILGNVENWLNFDVEKLVVGIGDNSVRRLIVQRIEQVGSPIWATAIHPRATIANSVVVDIGTVVMAGAVINPDTTLGQHTIINTGATVDHDCEIGNFVHIAPGTHLAGGVHIGDGAMLGIGCSVTPGCNVGQGSIVGAGAVVVCDVPSGVIAKGVPARWD